MLPSPSAKPLTPLLILTALLLGAVNVLAFAPFDLWPLQILTQAWLFWQVSRSVSRSSSIKRSLLLGWLYGFSWVLCGVHWLYISMHVYGGMASWLAALAVVMLALFIGLYSALAMTLASTLQRRWHASQSTMLLLLLPALWALSEWLRGWLFTGFPWLSAGYAHNLSPLRGYAPLLGVYGVAWLAAVIAGCCALLCTKQTRRRAAIIGSALLLGGAALHNIAWTSPHGAPITVRLLQGNIAQESKFSEQALLATLQQYDAAIRAAPADLIAIPETAIPLLPQQLPPDYLSALARYAQQSGSHLALGIPLSDRPGDYSNSVIGFTPTPADAATSVYRYDKHHLVPFGEFIPPGFRWFVDRMHIPLGDMTRGAALQAPFTVNEQSVLPNICYEDLFGEEIAAQLAAAWFSGRAPASILLNLSNIAWFGDSIALPQHLQISQMRALESGRPMLRATNTGSTAIIDPKGNISAALPPFTEGTLAASVQGYQGWTPYMLAGNRLLLALLLLMLGLAWRRGRQ